jgi:hypothetical protein
MVHYDFNLISRKCLAVFLAFLSLMVIGRTAYSQPYPITMQSSVGYDGYVKQSAWIPLRVSLSNDWKDVHGKLGVDVAIPRQGGVYLKEVILPKNSRQQHELYFFAGDQSGPLLVSFVSDNHEVLAQKEFSPTPSPRRIVLAIDSDKRGFSFISDRALVYLSAPELPARWVGYQAIDTIIVGDELLARLSRDQAYALRVWVALGGTLLITGAVDGTGVTDKDLMELLPVKLIGTRSVTALPALESKYGMPIQAQQAFIVKEGSAVENANVTLGERDLPLMVEKPYGSGKVVFLAMDFKRQPLRSWPGTESFWKDLLKGDGLKADRPLFVADMDVSGQFYDPKLATPTFIFMAVFMLLYVLVIWPINYILLKRRKKLDWAWITMPVIILFFSVSIYAGARWWRGGETKTLDRSVVQVFQDARLAKCESYWGILPVRKGVHAFKFKNSDTFSKRFYNGSDGFALVQTGNSSSLDIDMNMWSFRAFDVESVAVVDPIVKLEVGSGDKATGRVSNLSAYDLKYCFLLIGDAVADLGDLAPGQSKTICAPKTKPGAVFSWYAARLPAGSKEHQLATYLAAQNYYNNRGGASFPMSAPQGAEASQALKSDQPILIGFIDGANKFFDFELDSKYRRESLALVVIHP